MSTLKFIDNGNRTRSTSYPGHGALTVGPTVTSVFNTHSSRKFTFSNFYTTSSFVRRHLLRWDEKCKLLFGI